MLLSPPVRAFFDAQVAVLDAGAYWNCLTAATALARLLLAEGHAPWIGRLRRTEMQDGVRVHWPLHAQRLRARPAWTTHYVCVVSDTVLDPVGGEPLPLDAYAHRVFGLDLAIESYVAAERLTDYLDKATPSP